VLATAAGRGFLPGGRVSGGVLGGSRRAGDAPYLSSVTFSNTRATPIPACTQ